MHISFVKNLCSSALLFCLVSTPAWPALNETERSVEQTGETLQPGRYELSITKLMYGVSDGFMLETNYLYDLFSAPSLGASMRFQLPKGLRITPYARYFHSVAGKWDWATWRAGTTLGITRGERKQHSFAVTISGKSEPYLDLGGDDPETGFANDQATWRKRNRIWMGFDYSYYTPAGNLAFIGSDMMIPYMGFTWAWNHVHAGFLLVEMNSWSVNSYLPVNSKINANFSYFIPVPYVFLRF
ncbi:MAG: hypothetical protein RIQ81_1069 [Pseudomonadota bacterium]|jgi:hypothetical protein